MGSCGMGCPYNSYNDNALLFLSTSGHISDRVYTFSTDKLGKVYQECIGGGEC